MEQRQDAVALETMLTSWYVLPSCDCFGPLYRRSPVPTSLASSARCSGSIRLPVTTCSSIVVSKSMNNRSFLSFPMDWTHGFVNRNIVLIRKFSRGAPDIAALIPTVSHPPQTIGHHLQFSCCCFVCNSPDRNIVTCSPFACGLRSRIEHKTRSVGLERAESGFWNAYFASFLFVAG